LPHSLSACAVGPDYHKPDLAVPAAYKENADWHAADWTRAQPGDAINRGAWWEIFGDAKLNDLEQQVDVSNQSLKQAEAQYRQAAAIVSGARANYFPTVGVSASGQRAGRYTTGSASSGGSVGSGTVDTSGSSHPTNTYSVPFTASWEPDLWGQVRRTVEGDVANAQASAATLESTRLSLQAQLAQAYFNCVSSTSRSACSTKPSPPIRNPCNSPRTSTTSASRRARTSCRPTRS
jgi:outer membrane protein TolC